MASTESHDDDVLTLEKKAIYSMIESTHRQNYGLVTGGGHTYTPDFVATCSLRYADAGPAVLWIRDDKAYGVMVFPGTLSVIDLTRILDATPMYISGLIVHLGTLTKLQAYDFSSFNDSGYVHISVDSYTSDVQLPVPGQDIKIICAGYSVGGAVAGLISELNTTSNWGDKRSKLVTVGSTTWALTPATNITGQHYFTYEVLQKFLLHKYYTDMAYNTPIAYLYPVHTSKEMVRGDMSDFFMSMIFVGDLALDVLKKKMFGGFESFNQATQVKLAANVALKNLGIDDSQVAGTVAKVIVKYNPISLVAGLFGKHKRRHGPGAIDSEGMVKYISQVDKRTQNISTDLDKFLSLHYYTIERTLHSLEQYDIAMDR